MQNGPQFQSMATTQELLDAALAHHRQGRHGDAEGLYRLILAREPNHADALHLLGVAAHQTGRNDEAVELIRQAINFRGDVPAFYNNLGEAHRALAQFDDAIAAYQSALRLDPKFAEAHNNLGTVYQAEGRAAEALACFDAAIALRADYVNAHYNRARTWLSQGDFARGWPEYEWRWKRAEFARRPLVKPHWDGSPLAGRRLLVRAEQGLGDVLQFIRYVPLLQANGASVIAQVPSELAALLATSGIGPLVTQESLLPAFDVHASLLSLPGLLGTLVDCVPASVPYLKADAELAGRWAERLKDVRAKRVGICWKGSSRNPYDAQRSIPLATFAPLARVANVRLVSLQAGEGLEELDELGGCFDVVDLRADEAVQSGAFMNAAAVMQNLDLVIAADTAIAHLAGALAVPVWVLLSSTADWRWMRDRSDSPWYPTMRLFRQAKLGDWSSVMGDVASALAAGDFSPPRRPNRS
jgi:tetratricopeptide (TPR) repeat protein